MPWSITSVVQWGSEHPLPTPKYVSQRAVRSMGRWGAVTESLPWSNELDCFFSTEKTHVHSKTKRTDVRPTLSTKWC